MPKVLPYCYHYTYFLFMIFYREYIEEMEDSQEEDTERNSPWCEMVQDPAMLVVLVSRFLIDMPQVVGLAFSADRIIQEKRLKTSNIHNIFKVTYF